MKRSERHQLKENPVALAVTRAKEAFELHKQEYTFAAIGVAVVLLAIAGYSYWRRSVDVSARTMLAEAMAIAEAAVVPAAPASPPPTPAATPASPAAATPATPGNAAAAAAPATTPATPPTPATSTPPPPGSYPSETARAEAALAKYLAIADAYPSTPAGVAARYEAAAALGFLGRLPEAMQRYQEVIDRAQKSVYAETARLGLADLQCRAGQYDAAIGGYKALAAKTDSTLPIDGVLMQLGRAYAAAGKAADARQTFQRIVDEFPQSSYVTLAQKELENAKTSG